MLLKNLLGLATTLFVLTACSTTQINTLESAKPFTNPQAEPVIIGHTYKIQSSVYGTERQLSVRLPAGYEKALDKAFPVMFVIDGGPEQDFPHLAGMLQSVDINYTLEPFILIGIETVERRYEITPPADDARYDDVAKNRGGAAEFRQYIRKDVVPWVSSNYRTQNDHAVIGESLGGLFVIDTFLNDPTLFNRYAAISPSLWWDNMLLGKTASEKLEKFPNTFTQLYLSMGNEAWNMQQGLDLLISALQTSNKKVISWSYVDRRNSEDHGSIYHPAALDAFRTFYSTPYRTGASSKAFYLFPNGEAPELSDKAKISLEKECNKENAIKTTFEETNANWTQWNGVCVLMKPGDKVDLGN